MKIAPALNLVNYRVSDSGIVWRRYTKNQRWGRADEWTPLHESKDRSGYRRVRIVVPGKKTKYRYVHHLVLETFRGLCPKGWECRHLDGNPANNNLTNIAWGTPAQNAADRKRHGTQPVGEKVGGASLTTPQVIEIKELWYHRCNYRSLVKKYKLTQWAIQTTIEGKRHRHVSPDLARVIRLDYEKNTWTYEKLAQRYKVHKNTISDILRGLTWKHLTEKHVP